MRLSKAESKHLRRLVGYVRCEVGQSPDEMVTTARTVLRVTGEPTDAGKARLLEAHAKAAAVPKYIRAAIQALEKALARQGDVVDGEIDGKRPRVEVRANLLQPPSVRVDLQTFERIVEALRSAGYADADIEWAENCGPPTSAESFARETIFVICNSGMKNTVAKGIFDRVCAALGRGESAFTVFKHPGKAGAIDDIWVKRDKYFEAFLAAPDKVEYCGTIPWVGGITKYHLAKNFGAQVAKPDVHMQRLADFEGCTPQALCERLSRESGYKVATVDVLLWRACALGIIDSRTGAIRVATSTAADVAASQAL